jgi:large-conductance mechanosensitive channel
MTLLNSFFALLPVSAVLADKEPQFDPNSVTPGVIGFVATFVIIALVVLLVTDMVRRVRRTQYRAEVNERLDAEAAALLEQERDAEGGSADGSNADTPGR